MNAHGTCAQDGCDRSPATGHPLYRVNPKGEKGIFKCREHAEPRPDPEDVAFVELINRGGRT